MSNNQTQMLNWFVNNQGTSVGPMSAEQLRNGIASGKITRGMHVCDDKSQWMLIDQSPFASLLPQLTAHQTTITQPLSKFSQFKDALALILISISIFSVAGALFLSYLFITKNNKSSTKQQTIVDPYPDPGPVPTSISVLLTATPSLNTAIELLRPFMGERQEGIPFSSELLAMWMNKHIEYTALENFSELFDSKLKALRAEDARVAAAGERDPRFSRLSPRLQEARLESAARTYAVQERYPPGQEAMRARAMNYPDSYRGQRTCLSGSVVELHADHLANSPIFYGEIRTSREVIRFYAARSTENINKDSGTRFCGVITGIQNYSKTGGGTTRVLFIVGMFDILENYYPREP